MTAKREYLVIEDAARRMVFPPRTIKTSGYIPRDVAEELLGRSLEGPQWFTADESEKMRAHSEWLDEWPTEWNESSGEE